MMTFHPKPIPTDRIELDASLLELREELAEHVHDTWAAGRLAEGWRFGPERNDPALTHPGLVPYAELADSERDYDRRTAEGTLKAILAKGYRIVRDP